MNCFTGKYIEAVRECAATGLIFLSDCVKPFALKSPQRYNNNTRRSGNYKSILFPSSRYFGIFRQQAGEAQVDHVIDLGQSLCRAPSFTVGVAQRQQVMAEKDEEIVFKKVRAGLSPFCCDDFQMVL